MSDHIVDLTKKVANASETAKAVAQDLQDRLEKKAAEQGLTTHFTAFREYVTIVVQDAIDAENAALRAELAEAKAQLSALKKAAGEMASAMGKVSIVPRYKRIDDEISVGPAIDALTALASLLDDRKDGE